MDVFLGHGSWLRSLWLFLAWPRLETSGGLGFSRFTSSFGQPLLEVAKDNYQNQKSIVHVMVPFCGGDFPIFVGSRDNRAVCFLQRQTCAFAGSKTQFPSIFQVSTPLHSLHQSGTPSDNGSPSSSAALPPLVTCEADRPRH